eukprot:PhF_6_TR34587/c0_g2_i1/m.50370
MANIAVNAVYAMLISDPHYKDCAHPGNLRQDICTCSTGCGTALCDVAQSRKALHDHWKVVNLPYEPKPTAHAKKVEGPQEKPWYWEPMYVMPSKPSFPKKGKRKTREGETPEDEESEDEESEEDYDVPIL